MYCQHCNRVIVKAMFIEFSTVKLFVISHHESESTVAQVIPTPQVFTSSKPTLLMNYNPDQKKSWSTDTLSAHSPT